MSEASFIAIQTGQHIPHSQWPDQILDFGIAKVAQAQVPEPDGATGTVPGIILGTIGYMSPEQVRGVATDARADIFSVGAVLYECLTGRRAFKDDSDVGTLSAILEKDPLPLGSCGVDAPTALIRIVNRCLQKDPAARFQTASDFKFALESLAEPGTRRDQLRLKNQLRFFLS